MTPGPACAVWTAGFVDTYSIAAFAVSGSLRKKTAYRYFAAWDRLSRAIYRSAESDSVAVDITRSVRRGIATARSSARVKA